ncbi:hypothetical protein ACFLZ7_04305 [Nanoarchaeota archaeon]
MIKKTKSIFLFVCIFIMLSPIVFSEVGVYLSPTKKEIKFEPGIEKSFMFYFFADGPVRISAQHDFTEYVTFDRTYFPLGPERENAAVKMTVKLPEEPKIFGERVIQFTITEAPAASAGVGARAAVKQRVIVLVPFPGKYIEGEFNIGSIKVNDTAKLKLELLNIGTETVNLVESVIKVYHEGKEIASFVADPVSLESKERKTLTVLWNTTGIGAGKYLVKAFGTYDGGRKFNVTGEARVGNILVKVTDHTRRFIKDVINPFYINITSFWNEIIYDVYAKIAVYENGTVRKRLSSPFIEVGAWKPGILAAHLDTSDLSLGEHNITINLIYSNRTATVMSTILVENEGLRLPAFINTTSVLILGVIILVIANIIFFIFLAGRKKDETE